MSSNFLGNNFIDQLNEPESAQQSRKDCQLRTIFEISLDAIIIADDQGCYVDANPAACELLGLEKDELLGHCISEFVETGFDFSLVSQQFPQPEKVQGEFQLVRPDREIRVVEYVATINFFPHHHLCVMRDVTNYKKAEIQIQELTHKLEQTQVQVNKTAIGDSKATELALRVSENQFRSIIENLNDMVYIINTDGSFTYVSSNFKDVMGYDLAEFLDNSFEKWINPEDLPICEDAVYRSLQGEKLQGIEYRVLHQDGKYYWHSSNLSALRNEEGKIVYCLGIARYIHDQKQVKIALEETNSRWQLAIEGAGDGTWDWNLKTNEVKLSRQWKAMLGYAEDEILNDLVEWDNRVHPEDKARCYEDFGRHLKGETNAYRNEHRLQCKDGTYKWILARGQIIEWDQAGEPLRFIGTHSDISDRKVAELELEQFFNVSLDLLCIADIHGHFRRMNPAWEKTLGYSHKELENQPFFNFVHPDDMASTLEAVSELSQENPIFQFINRYRAKDGTYKYLEWRSVSFGDLIYAAARNITENKEAEARLLEITQLQQAILDGANYTIISTDTNGIIKTFNAAGERWLGYSSAELVNKLTPAIIHDFEEVKKRATELTIELGKPISPGFEVFVAKARLGIIDEHEWSYIRKDGSRFPVQLCVTALWDQAGVITGFLGIAQDITARKETETQLNEISERLSLALKSGGIGCWEWDIVQNTLLWDDRMYELYGVNKISDDRLTYDIWSQGLHPDDRDASEILLRQAVLGETEFDTEFRVIYPNGNIRFIKAFGLVLRDAEGNPQKMIGVNFDISDRKEAEILLKQNQKRYETLAEASPIGVYLTDAKGDCLYVNQTWSQATGLTKEQAIGPDWARTLHPEDRDRVFKEWYETALVKQQFQSEYRFLRPDGSITWVIGRALPLINSEGEIEGYVGTITDISDRKEAERNLRQNEQKYHQILDAITDMVLVKGPQSRIVWANKAFRDYYALSNEQLMDMIDASFNEPDYTLKYIRDDAYVFETGQSLQIEEPVTRYDGKIQIFNTIKSVIRNEAGEKILTVGVSRDISDRKQAEDALRASEEKLRSLFDLCPVGIVLNDMQGRFLEVNSAAETIYGYSLEELNQLSYWDLTPEKYAAQEASQLESLNTTGRYGPYQKEYIRKDGSLLPVELRGVLLTNNDGNKYICSIIVDLTDRQRQEQALRLIVEGTAAKTGEEFFKSCVQYLAQVLEVRYAVISEFVDSEKSMVKTLAFWAEDDFSDNFTYSLTGTPCKNVASNTEVCRYPNSVQQLFPEDDYLVVIQAESYAGLSIIDTAGNHLGLLGVLDTKPMVKDLEMQSAILRIFATRAGAEIERIKAEAALRESEIQLRQQTQELEAILKKLQNTQTQLIQSEKMSSLGQLVAGVAHEINNPVSFIYSNIQPAKDYATDLIELIYLYQKHYPNPSQEISDFTDNIDFEYLVSDFSNLLTSMENGAARIRDIVKSLRTFSRLDEADLKPIDIHENIESTLVILQNRLNGRAGKPEIHLTKNYGKLPLVECYGGLLNQVFMNLLVNAIDAIEQRQGSLEPGEKLDDLGRITITTSLTSENYVFISIQDNGCGISPQVQEKIFNPFFTTKPIGKGTGMGLAMSYQIVTENHQGYLRCFSTLGKGTEFRIELPIGQEKSAIA